MTMTLSMIMSVVAIVASSFSIYLSVRKIRRMYAAQRMVSEALRTDTTRREHLEKLLRDVVVDPKKRPEFDKMFQSLIEPMPDAERKIVSEQPVDAQVRIARRFVA